MRLGLVLSALLLCSCAEIPQTHYYVLEWPQDLAVGSNRSDGLVVAVEPFGIDAPYDQDRIVYRIGEDSPEVRFYAYHRWAVPLSRRLPQLVAERLSGTDGIASIAPAVPGGDYTARISGRLVALEELDVPAGQRVRVELTLVLHLADGNEIWSGSFRGGSDPGPHDIDGVVRQMAGVIGQALDEAREELERELR